MVKTYFSVSRWLVLAIALALGLIVLACGTESSPGGDKEQDQALVPDNGTESVKADVRETMEVTDFTIIPYQDHDIFRGGRFNLSEILTHGKPLVLNFWGARCPPCLDELPRLQRVYEDRQEEIIILGVDIGPHSGLGSTREGTRLLEELEIDFPSGTTNDSHIMENYGLYAIPTTFFLTTSGEVWSKKQGWADERELNRLIDGLVAYDSKTRVHFSGFPTPTPSSVHSGASDIPSRDRALVMAGKNPFTLDPAMSHEIHSHTYVSHLFRGLMQFDADLNLRGDLAESFEVDSSGTIYTFRVRDGATFHNGQPIAAEDVRFSLERATDPSLDSPTANLYLGDILGAKEKLRGEVSFLEGVKVLSSSVIQITIDGPKPYFLAKLTYPTAAVVDRENVIRGGKEWWRKPNGSGPFMLQDWQTDEILTLKRFDDFVPVPSELEFAVFMLAAGFQMRMYEAGLLDVAYLSGSDIDRALDTSSGIDGHLAIFPSLDIYFVRFNTAKPPFDNPKVRRAFAMAVDREQFVEVVHQGRVDPAIGILPPGIPGYSPDLEGIPFDPALARQLMIEAGYGDGKRFPTVTYTIPGIAGALGAGTGFLVENWRDNLGVEVQVRQVPLSEYFYRLFEHVDDLFDYGWVADYPDPENFLDALFHSEAPSSFNPGNYSSPRTDQLLEAARIEQDTSVRFSLYRAAEQLIVDEAAAIPIYHDREYVLVKPTVSGFMIDPMGVPGLKNVSITGR